MSDTRKALDDAIRAYVAELGEGSILTGWFLQTVAVSLDEEPAVDYHSVTSEGQPLHVTLGLIDYAQVSWRDDVTRGEDR